MPQRFRDKTIVGSKINEAGRDDEGIESFSDSIRIIGGRAGFVRADCSAHPNRDGH